MRRRAMPRPSRPMPSSAMLAGSGTGVPDPPPPPPGGAASVKADDTDALAPEKLRLKLPITLAADGPKADSVPAGVNVPRKNTVIDSLLLGVELWSVFVAVLATNEPPWNENWKLLDDADPPTAPGIVKVGMVTA